MNNYQINFMPEAYEGYCSTACLMGVLNYFWYTQFNAKDTWDVMKIGKMGPLGKYDLLDEYDIAFCLDRLGFDVSIYNEISENEYEDIFIDPISSFKRDTKEKYHKAIQGNKYVFTNGRSLSINADKLLKIRDNSKIQQLFLSNFVDVIKEEQSEDVLFLLGLDGYILLDIPFPSEDFVGGHIILCKGYKDGFFEIYDSGPKQNPLWIEENRLVKAMTESRKYHFLKIGFNKDK